MAGAEGKQVCRERLFDFYLEQAAQEYGRGTRVRENRVDAALCGAGLWYEPGIQLAAALLVWPAEGVTAPGTVPSPASCST